MIDICLIFGTKLNRTSYILIDVGIWAIVALEHPLAGVGAGLMFSVAGMIFWMRKA